MPQTSNLFSKKALALCMLLQACLSHALFAQLENPQDLSIVESIQVKFEGVRTLSEEAVLANVKIKEGMKYDQQLVDQSIQSLYDTGLFKFIQVKREPMTGGGSRLVFIVLPKYKMDSITYEGNEEVSNSKLKDLAKLEENTSLDEVKVKEAADAIRDYYRDKGYADAEVDYKIERDTERGKGTVNILINEGKRIGITEIKFVGNENITDSELEDKMKTQDRNFLSWLTGSGRFKEDEFERDLQNLREYYRDQGYLDSEINEDQVELTKPESDELQITINIQEGRQYRVGSIEITGNEIYDTEPLRDQLTIASGDSFSPSKIDDNATNLKDYYGKSGYLDTRVNVQRKPNLETGNIDLRYRVSESSRFKVEGINIQGNTKTKSRVILREMALEPGDTFDLVRMKNSQARLRNTGFFEEVNLSPQATNVPGRRDLRVTVKEGRTGNITFGAGFSSVERATVFAELTQGNFDLFNYRSMFQGDGQKFRLRLSLGSRSNQATLSFEEPWLFERELAFGFEIFRSESDFNSSEFDEIRTGFETYLRKRLFELVEGRLSYRLESVDIDDIDASASNAIEDEKGSTVVSKIGLSLLRDTRDNLITPTQGSRYRGITEFAGLGGDVNYVRLEGRGAKWWTLHDYRTQVFALRGRAGTVFSYSDSRVPFFDRFFLGGPNTLRGFDFREVGPKDSQEEPIGGKSFGFFSAEYSLDVVDPVRFAVFYDGGFANSDDFDFDPNSYNDNVGIGFRIIVLGAPLSVDFGYPIQTDEFNDDGVQFNFSFGTSF